MIVRTWRDRTRRKDGDRYQKLLMKRIMAATPIRDRLQLIAGTTLLVVVAGVCAYVFKSATPLQANALTAAAVLIALCGGIVVIGAAGDILKVSFVKDRTAARRLLQLKDQLATHTPMLANARLDNQRHTPELFRQVCKGRQPGAVEILRPLDAGWERESYVVLLDHIGIHGCLEYVNTEEGALKEYRLYYKSDDGSMRVAQLHAPAYIKEESRHGRDSVDAYKGETVDASGERLVRLWKLYNFI